MFERDKQITNKKTKIMKAIESIKAAGFNATVIEGYDYLEKMMNEEAKVLASKTNIDGSTSILIDFEKIGRAVIIIEENEMCELETKYVNSLFSDYEEEVIEEAEDSSMSLEEMAQMINNNIAQCAAFVEGDVIEVVVRAKKSDKVFIEKGYVTYIGKGSSKAQEIATLLDLEVEE